MRWYLKFFPTGLKTYFICGRVSPALNPVEPKPSIIGSGKNLVLHTDAINEMAQVSFRYGNRQAELFIYRGVPLNFRHNVLSHFLRYPLTWAAKVAAPLFRLSLNLNMEIRNKTETIGEKVVNVQLKMLFQTELSPTLLNPPRRSIPCFQII